MISSTNKKDDLPGYSSGEDVEETEIIVERSFTDDLDYYEEVLNSYGRPALGCALGKFNF